MRSIKATLTSFLLCSAIAVIAQINVPWKDYIRISDVEGHTINLDTITKDTFHSDYNTYQYYLITKDGIEILRGSISGGMGTKCGCEAIPHGYWVERYRNGVLKETGEYNCNVKIGTWTYFYDNGNVARVETRVHPYYEFITEYYWAKEFGIRENLLHGYYIEYYSNGKPRIEGKYEIVEIYNDTDSIIVFDSETYEDIHIPLDGKHWVRRSVKVGPWKEYAEDGTLLKSEDLNPFFPNNEKIRPIGTSYFRNHKSMLRKVYKLQLQKHSIPN